MAIMHLLGSLGGVDRGRVPGSRPAQRAERDREFRTRSLVETLLNVPEGHSELGA
jgi:hypothetical protein